MAASTTNSAKLDAILSEIQKIKDDLRDRKHLDEKILAHDKFINGNGKPGAKSQLAVMGWIESIIFVALIFDIITRWLN